MRNKKSISLGFGFTPSESKHHFAVEIPRGIAEEVKVYEVYEWNENEGFDSKRALLKLRILKEKWNLIADCTKNEFNFRLKKDGIKVGSWKQGTIEVERLLGKELILLLWAIEKCNIKEIENAIQNWLGLKPEERWWLFTMTNAATGKVDDDKGWRKAIRFALVENPIIDKTEEETEVDYLLGNISNK